MGNTKFCLQCGKKIEVSAKTCQYCGTNQYGEHNEYYSDKLPAAKPAKKRKVKRDLTDEEILALGLYPKDEGYKMSLISRILGKGREP